MNFTEKEQQFWDAYVASGQGKTGYEPKCEDGDSQSPKVSKFGGAIPHLPTETPTKCDDDHEQELMMQLYIPSLPAEVKALFPENIALAVFLYCTECMESNYSITTCLYTHDQLDQLIYTNAPDGAQIEPKLIVDWAAFTSLDVTSDRAYQVCKENNFNGIEMEEWARDLKRKYGFRSYLLGNPWLEQGDYSIGDNYIMLANLEGDKNLSLQFGDAGCGQLWMTTGADFGKFNFTWMCG